MDIPSLALSWDRSQKLITIVKVTKARRVGQEHVFVFFMSVFQNINNYCAEEPLNGSSDPHCGIVYTTRKRQSRTKTKQQKRNKGGVRDVSTCTNDAAE